jgi:hypothetical protein
VSRDVDEVKGEVIVGMRAHPQHAGVSVKKKRLPDA